MTSFHAPIDSCTSTISREAEGEYPIVHYPPHTETYLRDLLEHFVSVSHGDPTAILPSLNEPGLYALTTAIAKRNEPDLASGDFFDALKAELRWRGCRRMGADPTGPVRRGRLVQMVSSITPLEVSGASSLQSDKLAGVCPFCGEPALRVFLAAVRWRCFSCNREGGLPEFAEGLIERVRPADEPQDEPVTWPDPSTVEIRRTP